MITQKPKEKSLSVLIHECDDVFSKYIRLKYSINGYCSCFICSKRMKISEAQNGHFIPRDQMQTRYDEVNCHVVCEECNCYDPEHQHKYSVRLIYEYGYEVVENLKMSSNSLRKFMRHELIEMIEGFKLRIKQLKK